MANIAKPQKAKIHKDTFLAKVSRFMNKYIKYVYISGFYVASIYVLEYHFDLSLFMELAIFYGVIKMLERINRIK